MFQKYLAFNKAPIWLLSTLLVLLAWASAPALAHEIRPAVADVGIGQDKVTIGIDLTPEPFIARLDLSAILDTNDSPRAAEHDRLRLLPPEELEQQLRARWPELSQGLTLKAGDTVLQPELIDVQIDPVGDPALPRDARITLQADLPPDDSPVVFGWAAENGALVVRQISDDPATAYNAYLTGGQLSDPIPRSGGAAQGWLATFGSYIVIGYEHIVPKGLDHILFVLGLFFFSLNMRPLLYQVTAFTAAHTVTLALATLGLVSVPAEIVEPLIAASIVFVAVENILQRDYNQWRTLVVFCFGLLHGLGFAYVLGDIGLDPGRFITGLIGFNVGVELGQLSVILAAFLLVGWWAGRRSWYRRVIAVPASVAIAIVGAYWFLERTVL